MRVCACVCVRGGIGYLRSVCACVHACVSVSVCVCEGGGPCRVLGGGRDEWALAGEVVGRAYALLPSERVSSPAPASVTASDAG